MTRTTFTASVVMFGVPFLLVAACYVSLPVEVPVLLNPIAGKVMLAPKSLFTVFRVPFMNLTHGLMASVMLSRRGLRRRKAAGILFWYLFDLAVHDCPQVGP